MDVLLLVVATAAAVYGRHPTVTVDTLNDVSSAAEHSYKVHEAAHDKYPQYHLTTDMLRSRGSEAVFKETPLTISRPLQGEVQENTVGNAQVDMSSLSASSAGSYGKGGHTDHSGAHLDTAPEHSTLREGVLSVSHETGSIDEDITFTHKPTLLRVWKNSEQSEDRIMSEENLAGKEYFSVTSLSGENNFSNTKKTKERPVVTAAFPSTTEVIHRMSKEVESRNHDTNIIPASKFGSDGYKHVSDNSEFPENKLQQERIHDQGNNSPRLQSATTEGHSVRQYASSNPQSASNQRTRAGISVYELEAKPRTNAYKGETRQSYGHGLTERDSKEENVELHVERTPAAVRNVYGHPIPIQRQVSSNVPIEETQEGPRKGDSRYANFDDTQNPSVLIPERNTALSEHVDTLSKDEPELHTAAAPTTLIGESDSRVVDHTESPKPIDQHPQGKINVEVVDRFGYPPYLEQTDRSGSNNAYSVGLLGGAPNFNHIHQQNSYAADIPDFLDQLSPHAAKYPFGNNRQFYMTLQNEFHPGSLQFRTTYPVSHQPVLHHLQHSFQYPFNPMNEMVQLDEDINHRNAYTQKYTPGFLPPENPLSTEFGGAFNRPPLDVPYGTEIGSALPHENF